MYGFCVVRGEDESIKKNYKQMKWGESSLYYNPMPRFEKDKLFYQDEKKVILLDGVVFNIHELSAVSGEGEWKKVFDVLYDANYVKCIDKLRGSFAGVIIDKLTGTLYAFSNHTGERPNYYHIDENGRCDIIASHINFIEEVLMKKNKRLIPDKETAYQLLSTGTCLGHKTPFKNVRRITAGRYITANTTDVKEEFYHIFKNVPEWEMSLDECMEKGNELFRQAIKRIYDKNREYGYESECDLSGGLDSRMSTYVAHDMGYNNILNMCYCVKGNLDNVVSQKIAADLGNRYSFLEMNGNIFMDVDENIDRNGGQVFYGVGTGSVRSLKQINTDNLGMCCTGLLGELQNAYWINGTKHTPPEFIIPDERYSNYIPLSVSEEYSSPYENYEQMNIYEHSFNLFISSAIVRQQVAEVTAPFLDVDYIDFVFRVPLKYRMNYKYTTSWMIKYYPGAADYVWQSKGMPVKAWVNGEVYSPKKRSDIIDYQKRKINALLRLVKIPFQFYRIADMNPVYTFYYRNKKFRTFVNEYYISNIGKVSDEILRNDISQMFKKGNPIDKLMVLNYLGICKRYFNS